MCNSNKKSVWKFGQFYGNAIPLKVRWSGNREYIREFSVKGPKLGLTCKFVSSVLTLFSPKNSSRGNVRCLSKYWQKRAVSSNFTDWLAIVKFFTFHWVKSRKIYGHTNFGNRLPFNVANPLAKGMVWHMRWSRPCHITIVTVASAFRGIVEPR